MENVWRNDNFVDENSFDTFATANVSIDKRAYANGFHYCDIVHVRAWHGKGFVFLVSFDVISIGLAHDWLKLTSKVYYGITEKEYNDCLNDAKAYVDRYESERIERSKVVK